MPGTRTTGMTDIEGDTGLSLLCAAFGAGIACSGHFGQYRNGIDKLESWTVGAGERRGRMQARMGMCRV